MLFFFFSPKTSYRIANSRSKGCIPRSVLSQEGENYGTSHNSSLTFPTACSGVQRAGVVPVIRYSHFSSSVTVRSSLSSPQDRSTCKRMNESPSTQVATTYHYISLGAIPTLGTTGKYLTRVVTRRANFLILLPRREVAEGVHRAASICLLFCFPKETNLVRVPREK